MPSPTPEPRREVQKPKFNKPAEGSENIELGLTQLTHDQTELFAFEQAKRPKFGTDWEGVVEWEQKNPTMPKFNAG